jgi:hypothetical protein
MIIMPYDTTQGQLYKSQVEGYLRAIRRADLELPLPKIATPLGEILKDTGWITPSDEHMDVPNFGQILNIGTEQKPRLVVDGRQYMHMDARTGSFRIIAPSDWQQQCLRVALTMKLVDGDAGFFSRLTDLPAKVFFSWVAGALVQRYSLGAESQMAMYTICAYYYYGMLDPSLQQPGDARVLFSRKIAEVTGVPVDFVQQVIDHELPDHLGPLVNVNDLAHALSTHGRTIRMGELKYADLHALLAGQWFGNNARENIGVALEHLPTFIAIIFTAVADRSYRKSRITERVEQQSRGNDIRNFINLVSKGVMAEYEGN